jgi:hypothetical protein
MAGQQALALGGARVARDRVGGGQVARDEGAQHGPAARQLLDDHGRGGEVEAEPAVARGHQGAEHAELGETLHQRAGEAAARVVLLGLRRHVLLDELAHRHDHLPPLLGLGLARGGGAEALAVALEELASDDEALDLVGALADDHERGVAEEPLHGGVREDAAPAGDAHGLRRRFLRGLGGIELGHARLEVAALGAVLHARRPAGEEPRGFHPRGDAGESGEGGLGGILTHSGRRLLEGGLRDADRPRGDIDAARLEPGHDVLEAAPLHPAHQIGDGNRKGVEDQLGGIHTLVAELGDGLDHLETGLALLHDEAGHPAVRGIGGGVGAGEEGKSVTLTSIGDEHLRARDQVMVALPARHGADGLDVRARVRLGEAEASTRDTACQPRQEALALLVGAVMENDEGGHGVAVDHPRQGHPAPAQLLDHARIIRHAQAEPAVLHRHQGAEKAQLAQTADEEMGILVVMLEGGGDRHHLGLHEPAYRGDDRMRGGKR